MVGNVGCLERAGEPAGTMMRHYLCPTGKSGHAARVPVMWADLICELEIGRVFAQPENWAFLNSPDDTEVKRRRQRDRVCAG